MNFVASPHEKLAGNHMLKVDITIDHNTDGISSPILNGLNTSNMVLFLIKKYPLLKPMTLFLKKLLLVHELNVPFKGSLAYLNYHLGGIGSYCIVLMCVAFFNSHPPFHSLGKALERFLFFYGEEYKYSQYAIAYNGSMM